MTPPEPTDPAANVPIRPLGRLVVFEGPDGVGKSTLVQAVAERLAQAGTPVTRLAFPGRAPGSIGELVYRVHHDPAAYGMTPVPAASLQLLHVAAHLAAIDEQIRPAVAAGDTVLLDRYWWSTWVYGVVVGVPRATLDAMIALERDHWGPLQPDLICLISRRTPLRHDVPRERWDALARTYGALAAWESDAGTERRSVGDGPRYDFRSDARTIDGRTVEATEVRDGHVTAIACVANDGALAGAVDAIVQRIAACRVSPTTGLAGATAGPPRPTQASR